MQHMTYFENWMCDVSACVSAATQAYQVPTQANYSTEKTKLEVNDTISYHLGTGCAVTKQQNNIVSTFKIFYIQIINLTVIIWCWDVDVSSLMFSRTH
jgi:hypothetical protein